MNKTFRITLFALFCLACVSAALGDPMISKTLKPFPAGYVIQPAVVTHGTISVNMVGFRNEKGRAQVALFRSDKGFPFNAKYAVMVRTASINNASASVIFTDVPTGEYAISAFHDENSNAEFDRNWLFLPAEGYGTSNNTAGFWGPGGYTDSKFLLNAPNAVVNVYIHY